MSDIRLKAERSGAHTPGRPTERPGLLPGVHARSSHSPRPGEPLNGGSGGQKAKWRSLACLLLLGTVSATAVVASPGFDCEKARSSNERLLCQDQALANLDRETDRLYRLARDGQFTTRQQRKELQLAQRRWINRRDACWQVPGRQCLRDRYVTRIHELRTYYADARRADAQGISTGPLVLACQGFGSLIGLTFVGNQRDIAFIEWRNLAHAYVLERERGGPGVTYTGSSAEGAALFSTNEGRAQLRLSDQITMECKIEEPG